MLTFQPIITSEILCQDSEDLRYRVSLLYYIKLEISPNHIVCSNLQEWCMMPNLRILLIWEIPSVSLSLARILIEKGHLIAYLHRIKNLWFEFRVNQRICAYVSKETPIDHCVMTCCNILKDSAQKSAIAVDLNDFFQQRLASNSICILWDRFCHQLIEFDYRWLAGTTLCWECTLITLTSIVDQSPRSVSILYKLYCPIEIMLHLTFVCIWRLGVECLTEDYVNILVGHIQTHWAKQAFLSQAFEYTKIWIDLFLPLHFLLSEIIN